MSEVKRYHVYVAHAIREQDNGEYVKYSDYDAMRQQVAELTKQLADSRKSLNICADSWMKTGEEAGRQLKRAESAEAKLKKAREALEFYGNRCNWFKRQDQYPSEIMTDCGKISRQTLREIS